MEGFQTPKIQLTLVGNYCCMLSKTNDNDKDCQLILQTFNYLDRFLVAIFMKTIFFIRNNWENNFSKSDTKSQKKTI